MTAFLCSAPPVATIVWAAGEKYLPEVLFFAALGQGLFIGVVTLIAYDSAIRLGNEQAEQEGLVRVRAVEALLAEGNLRKWADLRRSFEHALETRFGALPAEARVRLDSWTEERLTEANQALPQARSLADLGLDD
jgi:hypothetical protein